MKPHPALALLIAPALHAEPVATANFTGMTATNATSVARVAGANDFLWSLYGGASVDFDIVQDNGNPGIGSGESLQLDSTSVSFRGMLGQMENPVELEAGETIVFTFNGRYTATPGNNGGGLRFGLTTAAARDNAIYAQAGTGGASGLELRIDSAVGGDNSPGTGSSTAQLTSTSSGASYNTLGTSPFLASISITRNENDYTVSTTVNGATRTALNVNGYPSFDSIFIGNGGITTDLRVDNITVGPPIPATIWSGNGEDDLWSNPANWQNDTPPTENTLVLIPASEQFSMENDLETGTSFTGITFQPGGSYSLYGNRLKLTGALRNESASSQTIETPIELGADIELQTAPGGFLLFGALSGPHALTKSGTGSAVLASPSSIGGAIVINQGFLDLEDDQSGLTGGFAISNTSASKLGIAFGAQAVIPADKEAIVGTTPNGTATATLEISGALDGAGSLKVQRGGVLDVYGDLTQSGPMTVQGVGGYGATVTVGFGGELTHTGLARILMKSGTNDAGRARIRLNGGLLSTGTGFLSDTPGEFQPRVIIGSGGMLRLSAAIPDLADTVDFELNAGDAIIDTNGHDTTISTSLTGPGSLVKSGAGSLTLAASSTRTGDTRIEEGTLKLEANNSLADESHIEILSGASLHLDFVGGDTVSSITFGNDFITDPGTYNAASHPNFISGGGALVIPASDPFADWIADFTFPPGADLSKSGDADEDGQSNLLEFALDGDPSNGSSSGKTTTTMLEIEGEEYLTLTIPVRGETPDITGAGPLILTSDGFSYSVEGSHTLGDFSAGVIPVSPALDGGMPVLTSGWFYRSFRLATPVSAEPRGFLRVHVSEQP